MIDVPTASTDFPYRKQYLAGRTEEHDRIQYSTSIIFLSLLGITLGA